MPFFVLALSDTAMAMLGSLSCGMSLFAILRVIMHVLATDDLEQDEEWRYDVNRINSLRRHSVFYRLFTPILQVLARVNRRVFREQLPVLSQEIQAAGFSRYWTPEEYMASIQWLGMLTAPLMVAVCIRWMGPPGAILAVVASLLFVYVLRRRVTARARYRLFLIKKRLPFLLDLLTLLMEAGSTFLQALQEAVDEFRDHPVGVEFGRVLAEMSMGKSRAEALHSMRDRLSDDEITSILGSIVQGEELGTPLARLFRTQADVLRTKRTQRAETIAGEAGVKMLMPAVLVMAATVLVILGPFVLSILYAPFL